MKPEWLQRGLTLAPFYYTLATDESTFHAALKHARIPKNNWPDFMKSWHSHATATLFENRDAGKVVVIVTLQQREGVDLSAIVGTLAHEATHLWQWAKEYLGEYAPSKEFEAYSIQCFTQSLFEEFQRQTKGKHHVPKQTRRASDRGSTRESARDSQRR